MADSSKISLEPETASCDSDHRLQGWVQCTCHLTNTDRFNLIAQKILYLYAIFLSCLDVKNDNDNSMPTLRNARGKLLFKCL